MDHQHDKNCRYCDGCGICLYVAGFEQVPDYEYPLFKCQKCGNVNFWD